MNNRNTIRANLRVRIYELYAGLFEELILLEPSERYNTDSAKKIVELFKTKIGYSRSTYDQDIFYTAFNGYVRWKETGSAIYQSHRTVRNHKLKS